MSSACSPSYSSESRSAAGISSPRQLYPCTDDRYAAIAGERYSPFSAPLFRDVYDELLSLRADRNGKRRRASMLLKSQLALVADTPDDLPADPRGLSDWMHAGATRATEAYRDYLAGRQNGGPRRFFSSRAHALYFLQAVAPTKLVDGSWLFGTLRHAADPRMSGLAQTYLEELGNGDAAKNHVLLYHSLLRSQGLGAGEHLDDDYFVQGAIQLALGLTTEEMLPEVIGFNLGYEQLPLHLLITAYELNELGLDPYYFTLHVTVDNADSGHARKAVESVLANAGRYADPAAYWRRVRAGYRLNDLGIGTAEAIRSFSPEAEALRIFSSKAATGKGAHSDYCRIEGRTVNQWLAEPAGVNDFVEALIRKGWITTDGSDPRQCRFWRLLTGDRAEMFGVFSDYELQVLFDWMRGAASADGTAFDTAPTAEADAPTKVLSFRSQRRRNAASRPSGHVEPRLHASAPSHRRIPLPDCRELDMWEALAPHAHWTPAGLDATQHFVASLRGG